MEEGAPLPPGTESGGNLSAQANLPLSDGFEGQPRSPEQEQMKPHRLSFWAAAVFLSLVCPMRVCTHTHTHVSGT